MPPRIGGKGGSVEERAQNKGRVVCEARPKGAADGIYLLKGSAAAEGRPEMRPGWGSANAEWGSASPRAPRRKGGRKGGEAAAAGRRKGGCGLYRWQANRFMRFLSRCIAQLLKAGGGVTGGADCGADARLSARVRSASASLPAILAAGGARRLQLLLIGPRRRRHGPLERSPRLAGQRGGARVAGPARALQAARGGAHSAQRG